MIVLGSFVHRDRLAEIIGRWLLDRPTEYDARALKTIVNLNSYVVRLYIDDFARRVFQAVLSEPVESFRAETKSVLKDFIVLEPPERDTRVDEMISRYQRYPEDFYRETPFEGRIFCTNGKRRYVGSCRIKRIRRISEKCSRRLIDYLFSEIKKKAEDLAKERALRLGIPFESLVTPAEEQVAEFAHAERRVIKAIRRGTFIELMPQFFIQDVVGMRVITDGGAGERFEKFLAAQDDIRVIERKQFRGAFNAEKLIVSYNLPREALIQRPPVGRAQEVLRARTLGEEDVVGAYRVFLESAEPTVEFEILLSSYRDMLESEIGRSMHEDRVIAQRDKQEYRGSLAQNVENLMAYLFAFCLSTKVHMGELPIKLWVKYMPDYYESVLMGLYDFPVGSLGLTM